MYTSKPVSLYTMSEYDPNEIVQFSAGTQQELVELLEQKYNENAQAYHSWLRFHAIIISLICLLMIGSAVAWLCSSMPAVYNLWAIAGVFTGIYLILGFRLLLWLTLKTRHNMKAFEMELLEQSKRLPGTTA